MQKTSTASSLSRAGLWILLAGQLLPMMDFSIINVALAAISESLDASHTELELIVAAYGVAFAVCLALGGRLGDRYGRRRLYGYGIGLFTFASLLCGVALNVEMLLIARLLQGVGAALAIPQILAILHTCLIGERHARAIAAYGAIGGIAFAAGQVLGGTLVAMDLWGLGWRLVFLINLPFGLYILWQTPRWLPEMKAEHASGIDVPGTLLLAMIIFCLLFGLALGPALSWPWWSQAMLGGLLPLGLLLWRVERQQPWPLLSPTLLKLGSMRFGFVIALVVFASWSGFMFVMALALQSGLGLSASTSGNIFISLGVVYFLFAMQSARFHLRLGSIKTLFVGLALVIPGLLVLMFIVSQYWSALNAWVLLPAFGLIGGGRALIVSCFYRIGLAEVPTQKAGTASAILSTVQQASLGLGTAVYGSILVSQLDQGATYDLALNRVLLFEAAVMIVMVMVTGLYAWHRRTTTSVTGCHTQSKGSVTES